jgi:excisionase family DNA binding protein
MNLQMTANTKRTTKGDKRGIERMKLLTTEEAAERLGVTSVRVRAMILAGRLPAEKFGHVHMIREEDLALVADRKPGRPPLTDEEKAARAAQRAAASGAVSLPFEPPVTAKPARKAGAKKTRAKKSTKKTSPKK